MNVRKIVMREAKNKTKLCECLYTEYEKNKTLENKTKWYEAINREWGEFLWKLK